MSQSPLQHDVADRTPSAASRSPGSGPAPPSPDQPVGTFPRRKAGLAPDGRRWELLVNARAVTALMGATTVAEAHVWHGSRGLSIELWADGGDLPDALSEELVEQAFAHPAVHPDSDVVVCLPRRHGGLLPHVLVHVHGAVTRAVGMSSLVEGRVEPPAPAIPRPRSS